MQIEKQGDSRKHLKDVICQRVAEKLPFLSYESEITGEDDDVHFLSSTDDV